MTDKKRKLLPAKNRPVFDAGFYFEEGRLITPGPWTIEYPFGPETIAIIAQGDKPSYQWIHIAQCLETEEHEEGPNREEQMANAVAICAVPDLIDACILAEKLLIAMCMCGFEVKAESLKIIRLAIDKTLGSQVSK